jgi:transcriptional regulator with XRE-family HTH domain
MKNQKTEPKTEGETVPPSAETEAVDDAPENSIGVRLRAAREARGLSQTALATRTKLIDSTGKGVARTVLVGYEAGTFRPGAREIRLICQALSITPNWLILGAEGSTEQASMELVRRREWTSAVRLAMAISILKGHERGALQSLALSMAGRQLGDMHLSSLLTMASMVANATLPQLQSWFGDDAGEVPLEDLVKRASEGMHTNIGNKLLLDEEEGDVVGGEWLYPDPGKKVD